MPRLFLMILLIAPMLITAFLAVWQRNGMIQIGYETESFQKERAVLIRQQKNLIAEISYLSSIKRIEQLALDEIQMKSAEPGQRIYISLRENGQQD